MAKIHFDRMKQRYGYKGEKLQELMQKVLANNHENIARQMARKSDEQWKAISREYEGKTGRKIIVPRIDMVVGNRAQYVLKGAKDGELISDTLRDSLTEDLRKTLDRLKKTGKPLFTEASHDRPKGTLRPASVKEFEQAISKTFEGYCKKDPRVGYPPNVHGIAVTEMRSATNGVKHAYAREIQNANPGTKVCKRWIHNRSLSKQPRPGHARMHHTMVPMDVAFKVPYYKSVDGKMTLVRWDLMDHPHAEGAPPEQVITCSCEIQYVLRKA